MTTLKEIADTALQIQVHFESGRISKEEFIELLHDQVITQSINNAAIDLEENIEYREIISGVISVAGIV
jgi:hypothetical protein